MVCFLTSSIACPSGDELNPANGFVTELKRYVPDNCRGLFVCSDPDGWAMTDRFAEAVKASLEASGLTFAGFTVLDGRNSHEAGPLVADAELVILAGGHVPTQNRFFARIGLREIMAGFGGVVIGISAGSMNSADTVYARPEREGEALSPADGRFLRGLGLTGVNILPHFSPGVNETLDGLNVTEDIVFPDSAGRRFYAIPDGSYLFVGQGREELRGEAYLIADGSIRHISSDGEVVAL